LNDNLEFEIQTPGVVSFLFNWILIIYFINGFLSFYWFFIAFILGLPGLYCSFQFIKGDLRYFKMELNLIALSTIAFIVANLIDIFSFFLFNGPTTPPKWYYYAPGVMAASLSFISSFIPVSVIFFLSLAIFRYDLVYAYLLATTLSAIIGIISLTILRKTLKKEEVKKFFKLKYKNKNNY